ncbi:hypothetical protein J1614_008227 [Plenodomus biglobosus]|nr:hypothetical protein J1614_008227 [Plenodomus biglobosus]
MVRSNSIQSSHQSHLLNSRKECYIRTRRNLPPTSSYAISTGFKNTLPRLPCGPRKPVWLKACVQNMRNQELQACLKPDDLDALRKPSGLDNQAPSSDIRAKRKLCAFIRDEELESMQEVRTGTRHGSELQHDQDAMCSAPSDGLNADAQTFEDAWDENDARRNS